MRSTRHWTTSSAIALLAVAACSRGHRDEPTADPPAAVVDDLARRACACTTLSCVDDVQQRIIADGVEGAVKQHVLDCADQLGRTLVLAPYRAFVDDLCRCGDRACYDGLLPRLDAITDPNRPLAAFSHAFVAEMQAERVRFDACDAKWSGRR